MSFVRMPIALLTGLFLCCHPARAQQGQQRKTGGWDLEVDQMTQSVEYQSGLEPKLKVLHQGNRRRALGLIGFRAEDL